ncbi:MAG: transposase [Candidatus Thermoplasmatota archaeon]|nr:transposase [Candidatus Thermoplasmatota archaeon]
MFKAYTFRLYPDEEQQILLEKHFGSCRFVWNHFLDFRNKRYVETGKGMSYRDMSVLLPALKEEKEWLNDVNSLSLQQELMHLDSAFHGFFKKISQYPAFKKKKTGGSFTVPQHFTVNDNHLAIPKFKNPLRLFMHRNIEGEMRSLTISKTPSGKYYASILAETGIKIPEPVKIEAGTSTGIDVGITAFLTTSDGMQIHNPKNLKKSEKKLAILQKRLSRKQKGSKNRNKAGVKVAKAQEHIANQRMDFHNKVSDAMLKAYDTVITEDLNVSGMMKNHHLARSIADAGWSSFVTMLKTKALSRGKNIIEIGRFDPSSRMCSNCGNIKHDLKLSDRTYNCDICGLSIDRDLNAAINIKKFGLIQIGIPTDSGEYTPMEISLVGCLIREGISHVSLK